MPSKHRIGQGDELAHARLVRPQIRPAIENHRAARTIEGGRCHANLPNRQSVYPELYQPLSNHEKEPQTETSVENHVCIYETTVGLALELTIELT